ncbi:MAG: sensor domain-containing diguanylate cyclase, partial [Betaproteobacteria bacterium]|nr:sensor domain-containing diguanylate cyclase [Betaproteobacteria bacterium]
GKVWKGLERSGKVWKGLERSGKVWKGLAKGYFMEGIQQNSLSFPAESRQDRLRAIFDSMTLPCTLWGSGHVRIDCNQGIVDLFGLSGKQEYLDRFFELSPEYQPDGSLSREKVYEMLNQAFETGRLRFEWMYQKLNGEPIPCEITLVRFEYENAYFLTSSVRDLREAKVAELEKYKAEERLRILLDSVPLSCVLFDENGNRLDCNLLSVDLFELSGKQEYLDRFFDFSPEYQPDGRLSREKAREMINQVFETGRLRFEWMHQKLNGEPIPCEVTLVCVKDGDNRMAAGYTKDLREIKATKIGKRQAEEREYFMFNALPMCCNLWDINHNNIACNQAAADLFELSSKQEYLDRFFELSPECQPDGRLSQEKAREMITQAFETGKVCFEWMHQKLNGEPVPSEITLVRVKDGDSYVVAGYTYDLRKVKATEIEKLKAEEREHLMFNALPLCCNLLDIDHNNIACNQAAVDLFELSSKQEYLDRFSDLVPEYQPDGRLSREKAREMITQAFETGWVRLEWMHQKLNGEPIPCEVTLVRVKGGENGMVAGYARDLRKIKTVETEKRQVEERENLMFNALPLCCNLWDINHNNIACNQAAVDLFELSSKQEYLDRFFELSPEHQPDGRLSQEKAGEMINRAFQNGWVRFEWMHQKLNGVPVPSEITLVRVKDGDSHMVAGYTHDLREVKRTISMLNKAKQLAFTDTITGIANRHFFMSKIRKTLTTLPIDWGVSIIMLDIDHFKNVNDTHGHTAGDYILKSVAQEIQNTLRKSDFLARYGGEEFIVMVEDADKNLIAGLAERLRERIQHASFIYKERLIPITVSVGVAMREGNQTLEALIELADEALYRAKRNGRNQVEIN